MKEITQFLDNLTESGKYPGIECIVYKDHEEVYRHLSGYSDYEKTKPVQTDNIYRAYSLTKVMTVTAALQLVEKKLLDVQAPVSEYLPEYAHLTVQKEGKAVPAEKPMLIWHLFSMTGGMDYNVDAPQIRECVEQCRGNVTTRKIVAAMAKIPLSFEPGERYQYSLCHDVLGAVIEVISGMTLEEYFQKNIIQPLGMTNTTMLPDGDQMERLAAMYDLDPETGAMSPSDLKVRNAYIAPGYFAGGVGLYTCPGDQILLADALACGGVGANGARILSEETVKMFQTNLLGEKQLVSFRTGEAAEGRFESYGYGYGMRVRMVPSPAGCPVGEFGWSGAAGGYMLIDPFSRLSFVYQTHVRFTRASWEIAPVVQEQLYRSLNAGELENQ